MQVHSMNIHTYTYMCVIYTDCIYNVCLFVFICICLPYLFIYTYIYISSVYVYEGGWGVQSLK